MKRILLLSTIFFPTPSVGSVRITNWARVLPSLGYKPLVFCRDYGYRASLGSLAANVHPDVEVIQLKGNGEQAPAEDVDGRDFAVGGAFKQRMSKHALTTTAQKWIIPDSQVLFWNRVYPNILCKAKEFRPDVILATAPAFSVLDVGRRLKTDLSVPFVADYRDPMVPDARFQPQGLRKIEWPWFTAFEERIYRESDVILHAIPLHGRWARRRYPAARRRCAILRHFVPEDMLAGTVHPILKVNPARRIISVVGYIRPQIVNLLAEAIRAIIDEDPKVYDLELRLVGRPLDDPGHIRKLLGERVVITGRIRHDLAKQEIVSADVLVNGVTDERQLHLNISSKLYEYAAARKPIIAVNPTRSDRIMLRELSAIVLEKPTSSSFQDALHEALSMDSTHVAASYADFLMSQSLGLHMQRLAYVLESVTQQPRLDVDFRELDSVVLAGHHE